jgi:hypothetical protein
MSKGVDVFELTSSSGREAYIELVNDPKVQVVAENDFFGVIGGGEGMAAEPNVYRVVDYIRKQPDVAPSAIC